MATRTLFELNRAYGNIYDLVLDDTIDLDVLETALQDIEGELTEKCANGIGLIRSLDNLAAGMKDEAERLTANRKRIENNIERIKKWYMLNLDKMGKQKVPTVYGTMTVCKAGGKRGVEITDADAVLKTEYVKTIPAQVVVDNDALRKALEAGKDVEGAHLKPQGRYLKIT